MFENCEWLNEPKRWAVDGNTLNVVTDSDTDFWRETHYGFSRDSGHFFYRTVEGDFTAQIRVRGRYEDLYDQAGIMVRIDGARWLKAGMEMSDGMPLLSSVLTRGESDWATWSYSGDPADFRVRVTVNSGVLRLQVSVDGKIWRLARLRAFPFAATYLIGPMCCTPKRSGLKVPLAFRFESP